MMPEDSDSHGGTIIMDGPCDPDAQATVTDFIDYSEYLPADLVRSLTLIRGLDERYTRATAAVHELTKTYGSLPSLRPDSRPEPLTLRRQISEQLSRAINAREAAYAESSRLYDAVDRHFDRLGCIKSKLCGLLANFSAEIASTTTGGGDAATVTPNRRASDVKDTRETTAVPKITLRFDVARHREGLAGDVVSTTPKGRTRGVTRAERIRTATLDPDTAIASTEVSDAEEEQPQPAEATTIAPKKKQQPPSKKGQQQQKGRPAPAPRSNVGKATSGGLEMSTSHALSMLKPPPPDAKPGSEHQPWLRLSDYEMALLRKKMKKNNMWQPSEVMINRELALRGRGWDGYHQAKANAELSGTKVLDTDDITKNYVPGKLIRKSEEAAAKNGPVVDETKLSNRGMKLNVAKKLKRESLAREQAVQAAQAAAEAEMAAKRLGDIGSTFKSLFFSPTDQSPLNCVDNGFFAGSSSSSNANWIAPKDRTKVAKPSSKKRKFDEATTGDNAQEQQQEQEKGASPTTTDTVSSSVAKPAAKKLKLSTKLGATGAEEGAKGTTSTTAKTPAISAGPAGSKLSSPLTSPVEGKKPISFAAARRTSVTSKAQATPTPPITRSHSRRPSIAGAPADTLARELRELRKQSATPAAGKAGAASSGYPHATMTNTTTTTTTTTTTSTTGTMRRSKRPAPGPVTAGQDGGAAVSVGRRKAKPTPKKKKEQQALRGSSHPLKEDIRIDEDGVLEEIDPNEPRYCICGDVSFGTMICCEDNDCDKEWFHLECIGLSEVEISVVGEWFCPECRVKNNIAAPDGIKRTLRRR